MNITSNKAKRFDWLDYNHQEYVRVSVNDIS